MLDNRSATDLLLELASTESPRPFRRTAPKIRYTHEGMCDLILENPAISQREIARYFGYTESWISTVITSDAFQALLASRRAEIVDPEIRLSLRERFTALTTQSLKILQEKLSQPADQVPDNLALRAVELGAKSLGIGGNAPSQVVLTSEARLQSLAHRLIALRGGEAVDITAREVFPDQIG
jgi:DNA-binding MarR family transcriptional regulator